MALSRSSQLTSWVVLLGLPYVFLTGAIAADDGYLSELDAEVQKVEARRINAEEGSTSVGGEQGAAATSSQEQNASRDAFEALLKRKYLGTYGFYKKLPERSRQEIFIEYRNGAQISEIRQKIINRLLQR